MRRLVLALVACLLTVGCDLNPQPEVPGSDDPGAAGATGAAGAPGVLIARQDEPEPAEGTDPTDYNAAPQAGGAPPRDAGERREVSDAGTEAAAPPPVVAR